MLACRFPTAACADAAKSMLMKQLKLSMRKLEFDKAIEHFANACRGF